MQIEDILKQFIEVNQKTWSDLESLNLILDGAVIVISPIERKIIVGITEYQGSNFKKHAMEQALQTATTDFNEHIKKNSVPDIRHIDTRNLTPELLNQLLPSDQNKS